MKGVWQAINQPTNQICQLSIKPSFPGHVLPLGEKSSLRLFPQTAEVRKKKREREMKKRRRRKKKKLGERRFVIKMFAHTKPPKNSE